MAEESKTATPPYVSYSTLKNTIRGLWHEGTFPNRVDHSVLSSMSGSARNQFLIAMRYFKLITDTGTPSGQLVSMASANELDWKSTMKSLLEEAYPAQVRLLHTGTPQQLKESFGEIGGIIVPAVRFLIAAAKDAGLPISPHMLKIKGGGNKPRKRGQTGVVPGSLRANLFLGPGDHGVNGDAPPPPAPAPRDDSIARILLAKFPDFDPTWEKDRQDNWFAAYQRLMDMNK